MKIVFLSYLHGFGGAERQNVMLANAMADKGHEVVLVSVSADNNCYEVSKSIKYIYLPDSISGPLRVLSRYVDIRKVLLDEKPDIVINFWFQSAYLTALMSKKITGKVVYSERGDPGDKEYTGILGLIRKIVIPRIDGFVFQSNGAKTFFNNKVQSRSITIPNPIFIKQSMFAKCETRTKRIVSVGRLHEQKNLLLLIDSFSNVSNDFSDYRVEIYGEGPLKNTLTERIKDLGLSNRVFLMGATKEVHEKILDASLFVLSSDYEGMPNALLEAMALGLPCISTDWKPGGVSDLIENEVTGLIVKKGDTNALSDAISRMLLDYQFAESCGEKAVEKSQMFQSDKIYDAWESYFIKMIVNGFK